MYVSLSMERFSIKAQLSNIFGLLSYTTILQLQNLYIISTTVYHYGRFVHSSPYVIEFYGFCLCVPKALSSSLNVCLCLSFLLISLRCLSHSIENDWRVETQELERTDCANF